MKNFELALWVLSFLMVVDLAFPYIKRKSIFPYFKKVSPVKIFGEKGFLQRLVAHLTAFVTLLSFYYALVALNETRQSGIDQGRVLGKQQNALNQSRKALQEMVHLAQDQRKLLAKSGVALKGMSGSINSQLAVSGKHLDFIVKQTNKKPQFIFNFGGIEENRIGPTDTLVLSKKLDGFCILNVAVRNIGDTIAYRPMFIVVADPKTVLVHERLNTIDQERPHYMISPTFANDGINRFSLSHQDVVYELRFASPSDVKVFTTDFMLTTVNGPSHSRKIVFRVKP
ncbi:hypothetical protein [Spirosoma pollinicola]|uniref:Uncharacterized protein n=1 Tax=Spirosoma pollinicola TaxID=2057025 RepID=A0A2K8Z947_9BACT|nr:hypothetical protein [Spirosoma pollinicola]AUD06349.1 hypothetical protein CWM47_33615 [Spirosoma pollinicola]